MRGHTSQRRVWVKVFLLTVILPQGLWLLGACSKADRTASMVSARSEAFRFSEATALSDGFNQGAASGEQLSDLAGSTQGETNGSAVIERKLVKRASLDLRVTDLEAAERRLLELMEEVQGWVAASTAYPDSLSLKLRVPHDAFDSVLTGLGGLGKTLSRRLNTEDVSLQYYDLQGRLDSKRQLRDTFRGYLLKASNIEEILSVETRLNELQNELDSMGAQFRRLADLIDYASIDITLSLPQKAVDESRASLGERLGLLFGSFGGFLQNLLLVIVGVIVYGLPVCAVALAFWHLLFGRLGLLKSLFKAGKKPKKPAANEPGPA